MSATQLQLRRDTNTNLMAATPASGEPGWNTTTKRPHFGDGSRLGGWVIPNFSDIQTQAFGSGTAGGSANAITLTLSPALIAYTAFVSVEVKATANNTGATTINVNGIGTKNIYKMKNGVLTALEADDIVNGGIYRLTYDGTQFQIKSIDEAAGSLAGWELLSIATGGGATYDFTSLITTAYRNYAFVLDNIQPATSFASLQLTVRRSGQGSFDSSGYGYERILCTSGTVSGNGSNSKNNVLLMANARGAAGGSAGVSGTIYGHNLAQSDYSNFTGTLADLYVGGGSAEGAPLWIVAGGRKTTTALDGVRFAFDYGNVSSGNIYMYGLRSTL